MQIWPGALSLTAVVVAMTVMLVTYSFGVRWGLATLGATAAFGGGLVLWERLSMARLQPLPPGTAEVAT